MTNDTDTHDRTAQCGCGALKVTATGEPEHVYTCSCLNCQRESGSAFTYCAVYPEASIKVDGETNLWRRAAGEAGRWLESGFCPTCGVTVFFRMEAWPGVVGISAGCFAEPGFAQPVEHYWAARKHHWVNPPEGTRVLDKQD